MIQRSLGLLVGCVALVGCGHGIRHEVVSTGATATEPVTMPLGTGTYDLQLNIMSPRAQVVNYEWVCQPTGGVAFTRAGNVGQSFAEFRTARLEQLNRERKVHADRLAQQAQYALTHPTPPPAQPTYGQPQPVYGQPQPAYGQPQPAYGQPAVVASGQITANVNTPVGSVNAGILLNGQSSTPVPPAPPAPIAVAAPVVLTVDDFAPLVELPAGDLGGGQMTTLVHMSVTADSQCHIRVVAEEPTTQTLYKLTRMRDLEAEARIGAMTATTHAVRARTAFTSSLVALGADINLREQRRLAAVELKVHQQRLASIEAGASIRVRERQAGIAAAANIEASLQIDAQHERQYQLEYQQAELRANMAMTARTSLVSLCVAGGADLNRRARLLQLEKQRVVWAFQIRSSWEQSLIRSGANPDLRAELRVSVDNQRAQKRAKVFADQQLRLSLALQAQTQLTGYLVGLGAVARPPMPAPIDDFRSEAPSPEFGWRAGNWVWANLQWTWISGGWIDRQSGFASATTVNNDPRPSIPTSSGSGDNVGGSIGVGVSLPSNPISVGPVVIDHRGISLPTGTVVVEPRRPSSGPVVTDHRTPAAPTPAAPTAPRPKAQAAPTVRDHR